MSERTPSQRYAVMLVAQIEILTETLKYLATHGGDLPPYMVASKAREALSRSGAALAAYMAETKTHT
jgi:hypothetical protein